MKNLTKTSLAVATLLATTAVSAASLNVRHEYKSHTDQHASRVKLGSNIGNFLVDIEAKFKGEDGDFLENLKNNGWELGLNYRHKIDDNWTMTYGMPIEGRSAGMSYKPQVRATYAFDSVDGLSVSARYRYDMIQNTRTTEYEIVGSEIIETEVNVANKRRHRITGNVNYAFESWRLGFEANWYKADGYNLYDNDDTNYELNTTISKKFGQWTPTLEFGDVSTSSSKSTRELRSRIGLTYSF